MRTLDHEMKGNGETDIYQRPLDRSRHWSIGPWRNTNTKQILAEKGVNFGARNRCGEFTNYIGETVRHSNSHGRTRDFPEISVVEVKYVRCQKQCRNVKTCILAEEVEPFRFAPWVHALILGCSECFGPKTAELWVKLSNFRAQPLCLVGQWWLENTCCGWVRFQFYSKKNKQHLTLCNVSLVSFFWEENCYIWFVAQLIRLEFESFWIYFSHNLARRPRNSLGGNKPEVRALSDPGRSLIEETGMSRDRDWASN